MILSSNYLIGICSSEKSFKTRRDLLRIQTLVDPKNLHIATGGEKTHRLNAKNENNFRGICNKISIM